MKRWQYEKGLHDVGDGVYAYLQPNGSWGWSNAGLITDGDASLLVDTLFDVRLTREMLELMRRATGAAERIDTVVNTHANGDHCWGNQLVASSEIIASRRAAAEMRETPPSRIAMLMRAARAADKIGPLAPVLGRLLGALGARQLAAVARGGSFVGEIFDGFRFDEVELTLPNRTFEGSLELQVGDKRVELVEVGPAHTLGDVMIFCPDQRTVFSGDILFVDAHPVIWQGPVSNWIAACDRILEADVETVVPGHGPVTDKDGVRRVKSYLEYLAREVRARYEAGMSADEAARDISLQDFSHWIDAERVIVNVHTLYRELAGGSSPGLDVVEAFAKMAEMSATARPPRA